MLPVVSEIVLTLKHKIMGIFELFAAAIVLAVIVVDNEVYLRRVDKELSRIKK